MVVCLFLYLPPNVIPKSIINELNILYVYSMLYCISISIIVYVSFNIFPPDSP